MSVAAKTSRIRIGTSVICAPFHNPLRLAEDIAAVDIASNGRFDLGIGVGSQWEEFNTFGIDPKERFGRTWEIIDIIERCLHGDDDHFDRGGQVLQFPRRPLDHAAGAEAHPDLLGRLRPAGRPPGRRARL